MWRRFTRSFSRSRVAPANAPAGAPNIRAEPNRPNYNGMGGMRWYPELTRPRVAPANAPLPLVYNALDELYEDALDETEQEFDRVIGKIKDTEIRRDRPRPPGPPSVYARLQDDVGFRFRQINRSSHVLHTMNELRSSFEEAIQQFNQDTLEHIENIENVYSCIIPAESILKKLDIPGARQHADLARDIATIEREITSLKKIFLLYIRNYIIRNYTTRN
jgi:hypothetical protein